MDGVTEAAGRGVAEQGDDRIEVPVLLVAGDTDPVAPASMATALKDRIPNATMTLLDRCGHWITLERPQESSRLIAEFLQKQLH